MSGIIGILKVRFIDRYLAYFTLQLVGFGLFAIDLGRGTLNGFSLVVGIALAACSLCFAAVLASLTSSQLKRHWPAIFVFVVAMAAFTYQIFQTEFLNDSIGFGYRFGIISWRAERWEFMLIMAGQVLSTFVLYKVAVLILQRVRQKLIQFEVTRTRLLISIALVMFVVATMKNLFGEQMSWLRLFYYLGHTLLVCFFWVPLILGAIPGFILCEIRRGWICTVCLLGYFGTLWVAILSMGGTYDLISIETLQMTMYGVGFVGCGILLRPASTQLSDQNTSQPSSPVVPGIWPSVWGWLTVLFAVGLIGIGQLFDVGLLVGWPKNRWEVAYNVRKIERRHKTNLNAAFDVWSNTAYLYLEVEMTPTTDSRIFDDIAYELPFVASVALRGVSPETDISALAKLTQWSAGVRDSQLSVAQVQQLSTKTSMLSFCNVSVVGPSVGEFGDGIKLHFHSDLDEQTPIDVTIKSLADTQFAGAINFQFVQPELLKDCWQDIARLSQTAKLSIVINHLESEKKLKQVLSTIPTHLKYKDLEIGLYRERIANLPFYLDDQWRIILETQIAFAQNFNSSTISFSEDHAKEYWKAVMISNSPRQWGVSTLRTMTLPDSQVEFDKWVRDSHLLFGADLVAEKGGFAPRGGLLVPVYDARAIKLASGHSGLEVLSFDDRWLPAITGAIDISNPPTSVELCSLSKLASLRELYLPSGIQFSDLSWMKGMNNLDRIELDVETPPQVNKRPTFGFKAAFCPKLKNVTLRGTPPIGLVQELAKLNDLQQVTFVNVDLVDPAHPSRIQVDKIFNNGNGVQLNFELPLKRDSFGTEDFRRHRERLRFEVRRKLGMKNQPNSGF